MWDIFDPQLRRRLAEIDDTATCADRVRAALLELLPAGAGSIDAVARKLGASPRTVQRLLKDEDVTFESSSTAPAKILRATI